MTDGEVGVHTDARIERESGRHVLYLDVLTVDADGNPAGVITRRIADYPTEAKARVAASWILRAARRKGGDPTGF